MSGGFCPGGFRPGGFCPDTVLMTLHLIINRTGAQAIINSTPVVIAGGYDLEKDIFRGG